MIIKHSTRKTEKLLALWFLRFFSCFSHYKPMSDNDAPCDMACLDSMVMVGRVYN